VAGFVPSGEQHRLVHEDQDLLVVEVGGGIRSYRRGGTDVIDGYGAGEMCDGGRGQILAPWPNRVGDGRFSWEGRWCQLALNEPERSNAIHGLVRWLPWALEDRSESGLRMGCHLLPQPGWPWPLRLSVSYSLDAEGLETVISVTNEGGAGACPFGLGWHPYLAAFGGVVDDVVLQLPASSVYSSDDRGLPASVGPVEGTAMDFRDGRTIGEARLDVAFTGLTRGGNGRAIVEFRSGSGGEVVRMWMDGAFTHLMVYTGDTLGDESRRRRGLAVEPMTCAPDMLRNRDGLLRLEEGQSFQASWGLQSLKF